MRLKPELSFDGVAVILSALGAAAYIATINATVKQHTEQLIDHEARIRSEEHIIAERRLDSASTKPTIRITQEP